MNSDLLKYIKFFKIFHSKNAHELCFLQDEQCSEKIISAHSIQNSFTIDQLHREGHLYTIDYGLNGEVEFKSTGRNQASTFTGFCSFHDSSLFSPIDFQPNSTIGQMTNEQYALFNFRALTREYWSKLNAVNCFKILQEIITNKDENKLLSIYPFLKTSEKIDWNFINNDTLNAALLGQTLGTEDVRPIYESLLYQIKNKKFHLTKGYQIIITKPSPFAVCSYITPVVDFEGKSQNNFLGKKIHFLGLNVFPHNGQTHIILTWHRKSNFEGLINQLSKMNTLQLEINVSKFIIAHSENLIFNKDWIDKLSQDKLDNIKRVFQETTISSNFLLNELPNFSLFD